MGEKRIQSDTSVIICAYTDERWEPLVHAVRSVQQQNVLAREIIVVVDHNPVLLKRVQDSLPEVIAVDNSMGRGLRGARNSGVAVAQGSIIAFLDDDAEAAPDWLEQLHAGYEEHHDIIGVGGAIEPIWESGVRPTWFPAEFLWVVGCSYRGMPQTATPVRNLIGCNMSFRREVIDALQGFQFGHFGMVSCDETEFCIRARQKWPHKVLLYQPEAMVRHRVSPRRATWSYFFSRCHNEGGSKAVISWLAGRDTGLSSEWQYTLRTLPQGVIRGVSDTLRGKDLAGVTRASAIVAGLAITFAGYLTGSISVRDTARKRGWSGAAKNASSAA